MLPLYMNGRLIQSAAQLRAHFSPEVMFRSRRAFAAVARQSLMPLSDEMRCAGLIFTLTTLHTQQKLHQLNVSTLGTPDEEVFIGLDAFAQLHSQLKDDDLPNSLCDAYMLLAQNLHNEKSAIIYWTYTGTDTFLLSLADIAVQTQLTGRDLFDFYLLLASGCLLANFRDTTKLNPQSLRCAFLGIADAPASAPAAFHPLEGSQYMRFPHRDTSYRLKLWQGDTLPEGATLSPVCLQGETHPQSSTLYQSQLCFHAALDAPPVHTLTLSHKSCLWCTAVYLNTDAPDALVLPQSRTTHATPDCVCTLHDAQDGTLRLLPSGVFDLSQYKNAAHRYFIESMRDEFFVECKRIGSELIVLTSQGEAYSSTGRTFASLLSLDCLNDRKD